MIEITDAHAATHITKLVDERMGRIVFVDFIIEVNAGFSSIQPGKQLGRLFMVAGYLKKSDSANDKPIIKSDLLSHRDAKLILK
jgi:hypothetical protein